MITPERIAELKALCEKAQDGPWEAGLERLGDPDKRKIWQCSLQVASTSSIWTAREAQEANAAFIAAARTALPELLEAYEALLLEKDSGEVRGDRGA